MTLKPIPADSEYPWTLDEFTSKANELLAQKACELDSEQPRSSGASNDSRRSPILTTRNVRHLASKGAIDPSARIGREAYYGPKHLDQVLAARDLMEKGFTSSSIQALRAASGDAASSGSLPPLYSVNAMLSAQSADSSLNAEPRACFSSAESMDPSPSNALFGALESAHATTHTTSAALSFLNQQRPSFDSIDFPTQSPGSGDRKLSDVQQQLFLLSRTSNLGAISEGTAIPASMAKTYDLALASANNTLLKSSTSFCVFETEPFPGLRLSVRSGVHPSPLTPEQKALALTCLDELWTQALKSANPGA